MDELGIILDELDLKVKEVNMEISYEKNLRNTL